MASKHIPAQKIAVLEEQLQHYKQCLDAERKSRLESEARVKYLEEDLQLTNRQLGQYQVPLLDALHQRRTAALNRYKNEYYSDPNNQGNPSTGSSISSADEGEDEIDGMMFGNTRFCVTH